VRGTCRGGTCTGALILEIGGKDAFVALDGERTLPAVKVESDIVR